MSSSDAIPSAGEANPSLDEQLTLALQREALEEVLSASRTYLTACFAIYGWDFILTFPDEYRTMWKAERWTPVRVAFFFNRYWGLLDIVMFMCFFWFKIDPKTCEKVHILEPVATSLLFLSCEFLLGARVLAMWNRRRWIIWFFGIFAICGLVIEIWAIAPNKALVLPPGLRGCISVRGGQNYIWVYWIPPLLYDTTATVFMLIPLISHWRKSPRTRLLTIFARDGVIYFFVVFICNLVNVIYFSIPTVVNPVLNGPLTLVFTTMMASRIILHLRSAASDANSRDGGPSSGSGPGRQNNIIPTVGGHNPPDKQDGQEVHLQSLGRRMEGGFPVSYDSVVVDVETVTNLEKRLEPSADVEGNDGYSSSEYSVQVVAKNQ
ncbi:hypothetical protein BT69DRAFT_899235 [Atractiella rhizophila]|nr:hypothetical protein BT69DRAFT_899235 [Atractiella rhizophila]